MSDVPLGVPAPYMQPGFAAVSPAFLALMVVLVSWGAWLSWRSWKRREQRRKVTRYEFDERGRLNRAHPPTHEGEKK